MDPTYLVISTDQLYQFMQMTQTNHQHPEGMNFTITDNDGSINHKVNFKTDGNKIVNKVGDTWLHIGAGAGSQQMVEGLIHHGGAFLDLNVQNYQGNTPLMEAVEQGRQQIVEVLIKAGADVNAISNTKVNKKFDTQDNYGIEIPWSALHIAAFKKNIAMAKLLIAHNAKIIPLVYTAKFPFHDYVINPLTPLKLAIYKQGSEELMRILINAGDGPENFPNTDFIHLAIMYENDLAMNLLLKECKIDVHSRLEFGKDSGKTLLHDSALRGNVQLASTLLELGADVDAIVASNAVFEKGETPLHIACEFCKTKEKNLEMIGLLLEKGANPNFQGPSKTTPFYCFVRTYVNMLANGQVILDMTKLFLKYNGEISPAF